MFGGAIGEISCEQGGVVSNRGVVYVVTGEKFSQLALQSLEYLRAVEPTVAVTAVIDPAQIAWWSERAGTLDIHLIELIDPEYRAIDKAKGLQQVRYERFIYLDADTVPIRPFADDMFQALDFCEVLALPGMALNYEWEKKDFSPALSQYNGGVVGLSGRAAANLPTQWEATYKAQENPSYDQASLRATILQEGYRVGSLPQEFNFRGNGSVRDPRILHFTGVSRKQDFYRSEKQRADLIASFSQPSVSGRFAGFAPAYSLRDITRREGPGTLGWWFQGAISLVLSRITSRARSVLRTLAKRKRASSKKSS